MKYLIFHIPLFIWSLQLYGQPSIKAVRVVVPPIIDGSMGDKVWQKVSMVSDFYQREPYEGELGTDSTQFFVCYDSDYLYIGAKCWDKSGNVVSKEMARNASLRYDDRINIILDTYNDKRNGYWFQIGPRGSIADALLSENGKAFNRYWQGIWTGKASIKDYGWEAELAIPFKTLAFEKFNTTWGVKFMRITVDKLERVYWPVANLNAYYFQVSDAGILEGIENITQGVGLDISPYQISGLDTKRGTKNDTKFTGGVDLLYHILPSMRSMLTINTDFAETELDARQINLTRFNIHYPEKRNFFLDGANYFYFGIENYSRLNPNGKKIIPFFSRTMGLDLNGNPVPINYGLKFTGQVDKWNVGVLHINDDRKTGMNNYGVARFSRNFGKQSSVGIIGTYGNVYDDRSKLLAGADLKLNTSTFQGNKNVSLILFGLQSDTKNVQEDRSAWGGQFVYPNDFLHLRLGHHQIDKNFLAGMGFVPRKNIKETYAEFELGPRLNKWGIMQVQTGGTFNYIQNKESLEVETGEIKIKAFRIRFLSGENFGYTIINQSENLIADFNIFDNIVIAQKSYKWWRHEFQIETKGARNVYGELKYGLGDFYSGTRQDIELKANWKVSVPFFIGGNFIQNSAKLPRGNFTAQIYQVNANVLFSPYITLYNYFQYDNAIDIVELQSRFQWIIKPGKEMILVWNAFFQVPKNNFYMKESSLRLKFKYNIRF